MSGWIKLEKDLLTDPRLLAVAAKLRDRVTHDRDGMSRTRHGVVTHPSVTVTLAYGALARIWVIGDTHIGDDDVLAIGPDEINQLVGIVGFCQLLPTDWLEILDSEHVKLPNFHTHNGTIAKTRALATLRQQRHRNSVTPKRDNNKRDSHAHVTPMRDQTETETKTLKKSPNPLSTKGADLLERDSRDVRGRSLQSWRAVTAAIDRVNGSDRTWADVSDDLHDPIADRAIEQSGGHRLIADRDKFNTKDLQSRFREAYESALAKAENSH